VTPSLQTVSARHDSNECTGDCVGAGLANLSAARFGGLLAFGGGLGVLLNAVTYPRAEPVPSAPAPMSAAMPVTTTLTPPGLTPATVTVR
jgi:hypothetical protein